MSTKSYSDDVYFANLEDPVQLASAMQAKITEWRTWASGRGLMNLWQKKLKNYYGISANGNSSQSVNQGGSEGELSLIKVNDLHNLIQQQLVLVTSQRPAGIARAVNTDTQALKSSKIGTAIAEYYMSQSGFEQKFVSSCECALLLDEAFIETGWDKEAGDPIAVDPETGKPEMSGDAYIAVHAPWNVARDIGGTIENNGWYIVSSRMNKFDAAATYPRFKDQILSCEGDSLTEIPMNLIPDGSDQIFVHALFHNRTASVPEGRYSLMIGDNIVVDTELPYKDFPIDRLAPSDVIDGNTGYSSANDILGLEEITDALHSIVTTNQITFGGQSIVGPTGANLNISDIAKGVRYFEMAPDMVEKLRPLQLTQTAPEIFNYMQTLTQKKQEQVGSVTNTLAAQASQGASGSSMALIQAQAIQYNSGIQRSYFGTLSSVMTKVIFTLAKYADSPKVARIVGKSKASGLEEFKYTGQDLNSISSIVYEMVNPVSQTVGGRMQLGETLIKAGMIESPKQYINLVTTGNLEVLSEPDENAALLILEENEYLAEGKPVQALITDLHQDHIKGHDSVLSNMNNRSNPTIVQAVLAHQQQHINLWQQASATNPGLLMATGQQPLAPPPPPPGILPPPPGGPVAPQGNGPKLVGGGQPPVVTKAEEVKPPRLPTNPLTHEEAVVPGATLPN